MRTLLTNQLLPALSWTFVHSLWQGLVLSVLASFVVLLTKRSKAALRYWLLCVLFFLFLNGVAVTFFVEWNAGDGHWNSGQDATGSGGTVAGFSPLGQWMEKATAFLNGNSQWIVRVWLLVFAFRSGRMLLDVVYLRRLRSHGTSVPGKHWTDRVQALGRKLGIRRNVTVVESVLTKVPIVIGHFKPLILVPAGLLTQMDPGELEAILLHELAHIRRHDYLVNFIQRFSELIFFFNPGVLWVSSLLRIERENCCDDVALFYTKNKPQFVDALIRCKERSLHPSEYALGLFGNKNLLLQRLTRIVYSRNKTLSPFETTFFILSLMALTVLLSGMRMADRPVRRASARPVAEGKLLRNDPAAKKPAIRYPPNQEMAKRIKKRLRTETVNGASAHPTGQKVHISISPADVLEADNSTTNNSSPAFLTANPYREPGPDEANRHQAGQADFEALRLQTEQDRKQAERDRAQAEKDRQQAMKDRAQAERDREQAQKDRAQAERDREQFAKDRTQAEADRMQAARDRQLHGYKQ